MVEFDPTIENLRQYTKPNEPTSPSEPEILEFPDFSLSLLDPLPEFDNIEDWIMDSDSIDVNKEESQCPDQSDTIKVGFGCSGIGVEDGSGGNPAKTDNITNKVDIEENCIKSGVEEPFAAAPDVQVEEGVVPELLGLSSSIEEEMGKFSLDADSEAMGQVHREQIAINSECLSNVKSGETKDRVSEAHLSAVAAKTGDVGNESGEVVSDEEDSERSDSGSRSDGSISSSSSSSSSDEEEEDDEEEKEMGEAGEVEEGEIKDAVEIIGGSDDDDAGETRGPIMSKNETEVIHNVMAF